MVSVYIPTHNRAELLSNAVKSVINQTYKNIEIIICNDGSGDNTDDVVNKLQKEYKDIPIVYLKMIALWGHVSAGIDVLLQHLDII